MKPSSSSIRPSRGKYFWGRQIWLHQIIPVEDLSFSWRNICANYAENRKVVIQGDGKVQWKNLWYINFVLQKYFFNVLCPNMGNLNFCIWKYQTCKSKKLIAVRFEPSTSRPLFRCLIFLHNKISWFSCKWFLYNTK